MSMRERRVLLKWGERGELHRPPHSRSPCLRWLGWGPRGSPSRLRSGLVAKGEGITPLHPPQILHGVNPLPEHLVACMMRRCWRWPGVAACSPRFSRLLLAFRMLLTLLPAWCNMHLMERSWLRFAPEKEEE